MKLSKSSQYAIRILSYMATNQETKLLNATDVTQTLLIPYKFLTKIMTDLVKANIITSIRGREGGYTFAKPPSEIIINEILDLFGDDIKDEECVLGIGFCNNVCKCALHDQWMEPKLLIQKMFRESTLEKIATQGSKI